MLRYKRLLLQQLDPDNPESLKLRELARKLSMPVPSLHDYVNYDVLPRIENISKMANYFNESISSLFSDDDDLTTELIAKIRKLSVKKKQGLLKELK